MRKRSATSFWTRALKRHMVVVTRSALRAGRTVQKLGAVRQVPRNPKKHATPNKKNWRAGAAASPAGVRRYQLFTPPSGVPTQGFPLMVMLHGCGQDGCGMAASTRMNQLATTANFMVLYPEQDRLANVHACWNWFDTRAGRAQREVVSILSTIEQVCAAHAVDANHIVIAGMSAGASMAILTALHQPERFLAVAMHSGVGPGMAHSTGTALAAMRGRIPKGVTRLAATKSMLPPLLVIQGMGDATVSPSNGFTAAQRWATALDATESKHKVVQRGKRYAATWRDWKLGKRIVATLVEVAGLGHAWSGGAGAQAFSDPHGPDASRMVWAFSQRVHIQRAAMLKSQG